MRTRFLFAVPAIASMVAGSGGVFAAGPDVVPRMQPGHTNQAPAVTVGPQAPKATVSPKTDQIRATSVIGLALRDANHALIGKISDLLIDRRTAAVTLAIVSPAGAASGQSKTAIAWSSLRFQPRPTPYFVTPLGAQGLSAGAAPTASAKANRDEFDVEDELIGKPVIGKGDAAIGKVTDLVLTFGTGRIVALVVETGGFISLAGARDHAVAWDAAMPQAAPGGSVRIALSPQQVDTAPVTDTMAAAPIAPPAGTNTQVQIRRDAAGNISGTRIPAPSDRR